METPAAAFQAANHPREKVLAALWQQESSNRLGAVGPHTQYGRALGIGQLLPSTAQGVAASLGWPYRPDLMTGTSPEAANYQRALSEAYLHQGLKATGNLTDALRYYYGGPDRSQWGPKTNAYAKSVMSRIGGM